MTTKEQINGLSQEQAENQYNAINATRFLLENNYSGNAETITELDNILSLLEKRIAMFK